MLDTIVPHYFHTPLPSQEGETAPTTRSWVCRAKASYVPLPQRPPASALAVPFLPRATLHGRKRPAGFLNTLTYSAPLQTPELQQAACRATMLKSSRSCEGLSLGDGSLNPLLEWERSGSALHILFHRDGRRNIRVIHRQKVVKSLPKTGMQRALLPPSSPSGRHAAPHTALMGQPAVDSLSLAEVQFHSPHTAESPHQAPTPACPIHLDSSSP